MKTRAKLLRGDTVELDAKIERGDGYERIILAPDCGGLAEKIDYIDLAYDLADAVTGDDGYYVVPRGKNSPDDHICRFEPREDCELDMADFQMAMFGFVRDGAGFCAIVDSGTFEYHLILGVKGGHYYMFARFYLGGKPMYEPMSVRFYTLSGDDADYSGIARAYRGYMLNDVGCKPIRERVADGTALEREALSYAKDSLYIRIRLAWKPVPSPIEEQTPDNEPPLHVAMTFDEVGELMRRVHDAGVKRAEFCLVGWNISGHDGRWPQHLPVEPKLGGEEGLKRLIKLSGQLGYRVTCHTNVTDSYSIADNYSPDLTRKLPDGSIAQHGCTWGGGRAKWVCPKMSYEIAKTELPKVASLGFVGPHYIDVISTIACQPCYDEKHPLNRREAAEYYNKVAQLAHELFGGFESEGGYDYTARYLDYGLYISFYNTDSEKLPTLFSESVPIWQIAFHGIILSNPYTSGVNFAIKSRRHQLEVYERGARPTVYLYSRFKWDGANWMGNDDVVCTTEADFDNTVEMLAKIYRDFEPLAYLQTEYIDRHEKLSDGVYRTVYSDGSTAITDYINGSYVVTKPDGTKIEL